MQKIPLRSVKGTYPAPFRRNPIDSVAGMQVAGLFRFRLVASAVRIRKYFDFAFSADVAYDFPPLDAVPAKAVALRIK